MTAHGFALLLIFAESAANAALSVVLLWSILTVRKLQAHTVRLEGDALFGPRPDAPAPPAKPN